MATLKGHHNSVVGLSFSPDSNMLATSSEDATAILWSLDFDTVLTHSCHWLRHFLTHNPSVREGDRQLCNGVERDWMAEGEELARTGDIDTATARFQQALKQNPGLNFDPKLKAQQIAATLPLERGEELAAKSKLKEATAEFRRALKLHPNLGFDPVAKAKQSAAIALVQEAERLTAKHEIEQALTTFTRAQTLDPQVIISADSWNNLCWFGALKGYTTEVLAACERAVALDPKNANNRDSRGVVRAQLGDFQGAIADFQAFIDWLDATEENSPDWENTKVERKQWIQALRKGNNPFTPEQLKQMF